MIVSSAAGRTFVLCSAHWALQACMANALRSLCAVVAGAGSSAVGSLATGSPVV